jgi:hypothetical protein
VRERLEPWIAARADEATVAIDRGLDTLVSGDGTPARGDLERWVEGEVERAVGRWLIDVQVLLAEAIDPLLAASVERANELRARALQELAAVFGLARPPAAAAADPIVAETDGLLRLDIPVTGALEVADATLRRRLPGPLGRRAELRRARSRGHDLIDRYGGRLRSAVADAVSDACRTLAHRRRGALGETLRLVEQAVADAGATSTRVADQREKDAADVEGLLERAAALRGMLEGDDPLRGEP